MKIDKPKKSKHVGADRRWTLLFIGDHGNVVTLKYFKAIVIGAGVLFFLAIGFVAVLLSQNIGVLKQNKVLQKRSADSEKQIEKLRHEKEILMARLVLAEVKTKENVAGDPKIQEKMQVTEPETPLPQQAPKPEPVKTDPKKPPVPQVAQPESEVGETDEAEPVISVAVANFKISLESENQNLDATFKIRNTSSEPQRVEGHAVVVLKGDDLQKDQWLVMPAVGLAGEKPSGKRGKSFSIQRFRTMSFTSKAPDYSDQFETAAVYVFTKTGELLLEQDFSVKLPPVPLISPDGPSTQAVSEEEAPSGQSPGDEAPASEEPSIDFSVDSLKNAAPVF
jgi:hypothetical protein